MTTRVPLGYLIAGATMTALVVLGVLAKLGYIPVSRMAIGLTTTLALLAVTVWLRWRARPKSRDGDTEAACAAETPAAQRFIADLTAWMALYVFLVVLISWVLDIELWPLWARVAASLAPAFAIGGVILAMLRYLATEPDEFQRMIMTQAVLIGMGAAFFFLTAWGFLEFYVDAPHFPTGLAMVPFWAAFGVANGLVRLRYR